MIIRTKKGVGKTWEIWHWDKAMRCRNSQNTFWKRTWFRLKMCPFLPIGEVHMPDALGRKYSDAGKEWAWQYVFPAARLSLDPRSGRIGRHHISDTAFQKMIKQAIQKAGITKHGSVHTLRHSFATHLLMNGVNIGEVQELLGHKHVETRDMSGVPQSTLNLLLVKEQSGNEAWLNGT